MEDVRSLNDLIRIVGSAQAGSRRLDALVAYHCGEVRGDAQQMVRLLIDEGSSWDLIFELMEGEVPPYTNSLDAALPGENIVCSIYSSKYQRWGAVHRSKVGGEVVAWAETEILARRLAALKGLLQQLGAAEAPRPQEQAMPVPKPAQLPQPPAASLERTLEESLQENHETAELAEVESEWKILF